MTERPYFAILIFGIILVIAAVLALIIVATSQGLLASTPYTAAGFAFGVWMIGGGSAIIAVLVRRRKLPVGGRLRRAAGRVKPRSLPAPAAPTRGRCYRAGRARVAPPGARPAGPQLPPVRTRGTHGRVGVAASVSGDGVEAATLQFRLRDVSPRTVRPDAAPALFEGCGAGAASTADMGQVWAAAGRQHLQTLAAPGAVNTGSRNEISPSGKAGDL